MAAFYFDEITITHVAGDEYSFKATSNLGFSPSVNAVLSPTPATTDKSAKYIIPSGTTNSNQVKFPIFSVDFNDYVDDMMFKIDNEYPDFDNLADFKGGFCIKDNDYPPPRPGGAIPIGYFEAMPKIRHLNALALAGVFKIKSIVLTRVMDKTYTAVVKIEDISPRADYIFSSVQEQMDRRHKKPVLILGVKKTTPGAGLVNMTFSDPALYLCLGNEEGGMPIIIYDETTVPASQINWKTMATKNGVIYFD
jgi:hypothetical protein